MATANKRVNYPKNRKPSPLKEFICDLCGIVFESRYKGTRHYCDSCKVQGQRLRAIKWYSKNKYRYKPIRRAITLQRRYSISVENYDEMYNKQDGKCAICGKWCPNGSCNGLCVDHDHKTNVIRGLLCKSCNLTLGRLENNWNEFMEYLSVGFIGNRSL